MDRDRDTGQYLSCHHERRHKSKLAYARAFCQLSKSNQGMGSDPGWPNPFVRFEPDDIRLYFN